MTVDAPLPPARKTSPRPSFPVREIRQDLTWYFTQADAAVGFHSAQSSLQARCWGIAAGGPIDPDPYTDGIIASTTRYRRIRRVLFSLPRDVRRALEATYDRSFYLVDAEDNQRHKRKEPACGHVHRYPVELLRIFGAKAGCALFQTVIPYNVLLRLCRQRVAKRAFTEVDEKLWFLVGEEVRQLFDRIHHDYWLTAALQKRGLA
jgi:hypothetical protein